jgi:hypothetical protein
MLSAHVQQTGSHFGVDRGVVGGGGVNWLRSFFAEGAACIVLVRTQFFVKKCAVTLNLRLMCGEGETACHVMGAARRKT